MNRQIWMYLIFGILTTFINVISFVYVNNVLNNYKLATSIAFFISIIFSYIMNRKYVFKSNIRGRFGILKEFFKFLFGRMSTYFIDIIGMIILVSYLNLKNLNSKVIINILVVIVNYLISKFVIFKEKK